MPKWMADASEKFFGKYVHPVKVTDITFLHKDLKKVRFEGDLSDTDFTPGNVIEFRVNDRDFRHYTPSFYHSEKGVCEVVFYLHGKGPGNLWAENLKEGDRVKLLGPGGKLNYNKSCATHFLFGDEASLGMAMCLQKTAQLYGQQLRVLLEMESRHKTWINLIGGKHMYVEQSVQYPAQSAIESLKKTDFGLWNSDHPTAIYLTGRAKSIQQLRRFLLSKGVSKKQIQTEPYWADGKRGL